MDSFGCAVGTLGEQQKLQQDHAGQACPRRPPSLVSVQTDRSPSAATNVDFNASPGHRSSLDGSFIQDEDLHLIYGRFEYGRGPLDDIKVASCDYEVDGQLLVDAVDAPSLGKDIELHLQNKLANDCDVNVAFLDFNSFTADRIADALKDRFCKTSGSFESENCLTPPAPLGHNSCSLFSSCGGDVDPVNDQSACSAASLFPLLPSSYPKNEVYDVELHGEAEEGDEATNGKPAYKKEKSTNIGKQDQQEQHPQVISTDSLDWSSYNRGQEIIKTACTTKAGDYVLTFDDSASSMISSVASFSVSSPESPADATSVGATSEGNEAPRSVASGATKQTMISWNQLGDDSIRRHGSLPRGKTFPGTCSPQSNRTPAQVAPCAKEATGSSNSRFSLLKAFKEKVSDTFDRMHSHGRRKMDKAAPAAMNRSSEAQTKSSCTGGIESSGYHTGGTQSSQMGDLQQVRRDGDAASAGSSPLESPYSGAMGHDAQQRCHTAVLRRDNSNYEGADCDVSTASNGRCVDINHNVVGFRTAGSGPWMGRAMAESGGEWKHVLTSNGRTFVDLLRKKETVDTPTDGGPSSGEQRFSRSPSVSVANKSVQTCLRGVPSLAPLGCFDELQGVCCGNGGGSSSRGNLPELNFLRLPFSLPPLFPTVAPFPVSMFKRLDCQRADLLCSPLVGDVRRGVGSSHCCRNGAGFLPAKLVPSPPRVPTNKAGRTRRLGLRQPVTKRDSGFESYAQVPSHIQDWESLAMLLPEEVQRTFFNGCLSKSSCGTAGRGILKSFRSPSSFCRHQPINTDKPLTCSTRSVDNLLWRNRMGVASKAGRPLSEPCFQRDPPMPLSCAGQAILDASPVRHCSCVRQCCCGYHSCSGCVAYAHRNLCCLCATWEHQEPTDIGCESSPWFERPSDLDMNHRCTGDHPCFRSARSESSCRHCGRALNGAYSPDCFFSMENVTRFHQYYQQPVGFTLKKCNSTRRLAAADDNDLLGHEAATVPFVQNAPIRLRSDGICKRLQIGVSLHRQKHDMVYKFLLSCDRLKSNLTPDATLFEKLQLLHRFVINSIIDFIEDGLVVANSVWSVIVSATKLGPATRSVCDLVSALESRNAYKNLKVDLFFLGLFRLQSLDCWLSYLVLKDNLLRKCYLKSAFLRGARSVYSFLYEKILAKIQSLYNAFKFDREVGNEMGSENVNTLGDTLSVLDEFVAHLPNPVVANPCDKEFENVASCSSIGQHFGKGETLTKSFIPALPAGDTRIPKSSSYPSRIPTSVDRRSNRKVVKAISRK